MSIFKKTDNSKSFIDLMDEKGLDHEYLAKLLLEGMDSKGHVRFKGKLYTGVSTYTSNSINFKFLETGMRLKGMLD